VPVRAAGRIAVDEPGNALEQCLGGGVIVVQAQGDERADGAVRCLVERVAVL
jgi:hypothetical protein